VRGFDVLILAVAAAAAGGAWLSLAQSSQTLSILKDGVASLGSAAQPAAPTGPVDVNVTDEDPVLGPDDAPVTLVEFSDFQCPFCSRFEPMLKRVLEDYAGKVRLVYKDFPLSQIHEQATPAAEAAQCVAALAGDEAFFAFHGELFADQAALGPNRYAAVAAGIDGLDAERFAACVEDGQTAAEVADDYKDGLAVGVQGTPATFVNGVVVEGADEAALRAAIDAALKK